ncbi:hypothetical protein Pmani_030686 [Petrolisthes manimaculis]|uniref:Uncharacterized protein n=1 Tax=Petrolisthes manimaculis TaxID=1843537 RepID=A0AAE1NV42_9EUCA|nr:hypothetical protein Pmani_030686 [Petrolisthes manimaculis]
MRVRKANGGVGGEGEERRGVWTVVVVVVERRGVWTVMVVVERWCVDYSGGGEVRCVDCNGGGGEERCVCEECGGGGSGEKIRRGSGEEGRKDILWKGGVGGGEREDGLESAEKWRNVGKKW